MKQTRRELLIEFLRLDLERRRRRLRAAERGEVPDAELERDAWHALLSEITNSKGGAA